MLPAAHQSARRRPRNCQSWCLSHLGARSSRRSRGELRAGIDTIYPPSLREYFPSGLIHQGGRQVLPHYMGPGLVRSTWLSKVTDVDGRSLSQIQFSD